MTTIVASTQKPRASDALIEPVAYIFAEDLEMTELLATAEHLGMHPWELIDWIANALRANAHQMV